MIKLTIRVILFGLTYSPTLMRGKLCFKQGYQMVYSMYSHSPVKYRTTTFVSREALRREFSRKKIMLLGITNTI